MVLRRRLDHMFGAGLRWRSCRVLPNCEGNASDHLPVLAEALVPPLRLDKVSGVVFVLLVFAVICSRLGQLSIRELRSVAEAVRVAPPLPPDRDELELMIKAVLMSFQ